MPFSLGAAVSSVASGFLLAKVSDIYYSSNTSQDDAETFILL